MSIESYWHWCYYQANKGVNSALNSQKLKKMEKIW